MKKVSLSLYVKTALLVVFLINNSQAQLSSWFRIYADDEATPARFDHINFSINYNSWNHTLSEIETKPYSLGFDLSLFKDIPLSKKGNVSLGVGLNYSANNVHHNGDILYINDSLSEDTRTEIVKSTQNYRKNKLFTSYLDLPVELRIRKLGKSKLRFYAGFKAGVLLQVNTTRSTANEKIKVYRIQRTNPYRYGPTLKIGYDKFNIYGFYSLTPLFEDAGNSKINPFTIGVVFFVL